MSNPNLSLIYLLLFTLCSTLLTSCRTVADQTTQTTTHPEEPVTFTILQLNDVYEIAPLENGKVGGLARVATLLKQLEAENPNTIAVLAGDFLSPSFMANIRQENGEKIAGLQMVETLNAMGLDYATFGNHEFDLPSAQLVSKRINQSEFKYMSCNALQVDQDEIKPFFQHGNPVPEYIIHHFNSADGRVLKLAIVGVVLPFNKRDFVFYKDVKNSFTKAVNKAKQEADVVIGLTHLNMVEDEELAAHTSDVPLFIGGHDHDQMSRHVGTTAITKADANAKTVYVHRITYYPSCDISQINSIIVPIGPELSFEPETQAVVDKWQSRLDSLVINLGYDPAASLRTLSEPLIGTEVAVRSRQTNYGLLMNKAVEAAWPGADVYLFNGGALRLDDELSGEITEYDVLRSFPYGGPVVRMSIDGASLQRMLNIGTRDNVGKGGFLQIYNAKSQGGRWLIGDVLLDEQKQYEVVLPKFVAQGLEMNLGFLKGNKFDTQKQLFGGTVKNDVRDILIKYLRE